MELPVPIGYMPLAEALEAMKDKMADVDMAAQKIAEACESGLLAAGYRSLHGADPLDPAVWRRPNWRSFIETGVVLLTLPLLDGQGRAAASGFTTQCEREIFIRRASFERFVASIRPTAPARAANAKTSRARVDEIVRAYLSAATSPTMDGARAAAKAAGVIGRRAQIDEMYRSHLKAKEVVVRRGRRRKSAAI